MVKGHTCYNNGSAYMLGKTEALKWTPCTAPELTYENTKPIYLAVPKFKIKVPTPHRQGVATPKIGYVRAKKEEFDHIRALPCQWPSCDKPAPSEASHRNQGKGMGIKTHDVFAALCREHHSRIDQGSDLMRSERDHLWLTAFYNTEVALRKKLES